jgi:archaeal flagellar protein FlaJ
MRITKKLIKQLSIISTVVGVLFFVLSVVVYLNSPILDYMVVLALTIAVVPPSIAAVSRNRWKNEIEKAIPEFLRDLATSSRTGTPLQAALEHASKRMYGPLTNELRILVAHMSWGMNFNEALTEFSDRTDIPLVRKAAVLIIEAGKHGGDLSDIFGSTANYVENVNAWTAKRRMQTLPYVAVFYFSVFIFLFIIIIISNMIFAPMNQIAASGTALIKPLLTTDQTRRIFLDAALIESLFGGLIAGKISEDSFMDGLKHVSVLAIASGLAFYFFFH